MEQSRTCSQTSRVQTWREEEWGNSEGFWILWSHQNQGESSFLVCLPVHRNQSSVPTPQCSSTWCDLVLVPRQAEFYPVFLNSCFLKCVTQLIGRWLFWERHRITVWLRLEGTSQGHLVQPHIGCPGPYLNDFYFSSWVTTALLFCPTVNKVDLKFIWTSKDLPPCTWWLQG